MSGVLLAGAQRVEPLLLPSVKKAFLTTIKKVWVMSHLHHNMKKEEIDQWLFLPTYYLTTTKPFLMASTTACVRSFTLIFCNILLTWFLTVFSLI